MAQKKTEEVVEIQERKQKCGIIMPISAIDGCPSEHWEDVKKILQDAIASADYEANLVSDSDESGVIQNKIVQNLYDNEIVVCDVSGRNPNVMFELGMRLAFDKPTIIIMDDKTPFSFDTELINHLCYPRDLNYHKILKFKDDLKTMILGTVKAASSRDYTTFLKHFGEFKVAKIEHKEGDINTAVLAKLENMTNQINILQRMAFSRAPMTRDNQTEDINRIRQNYILSELNRFCLVRGIPVEQMKSSSPDSPERRSFARYLLEKNPNFQLTFGSLENLIVLINDVLR